MAAALSATILRLLCLSESKTDQAMSWLTTLASANYALTTAATAFTTLQSLPLLLPEVSSTAPIAIRDTPLTMRLANVTHALITVTLGASTTQFLLPILVHTALFHVLFAILDMPTISSQEHVLHVLTTALSVLVSSKDVNTLPVWLVTKDST